MNVRLTLSKKTYYALGMLSAALTMAAALGAAVRFPMALAENLATLLTLLMLGFLASVKGTTKQDKKALVGCILLQVLALALPAALLQHLLLALVWPCFAGWEKAADPRLGKGLVSIEYQLRFSHAHIILQGPARHRYIKSIRYNRPRQQQKGRR